MKIAFFVFIALLACRTAVSQEFSGHSLFLGTGIGIMTNSTSEGFGVTSGFGLQSTVWHERVRLIPQYTWGGYNNLGISDVPDVQFYSRSLKLDLNVDLLKFRSLALMIGTGVTGNLTSGLVGTGGRSGSTSSYFFREAHVGVDVMAGFRVFSKDKRFAYELRLFDVGFKPVNNTDFVEAAIFKFKLLYNIRGTDAK